MRTTCRSCRPFAALLLVHTLYTTFGFPIIPIKSCQKRQWQQSSCRSSFARNVGAAAISDEDWKSDLLNIFSGDFDNYNQVVNDRENNLLPREGGGHEHIHCTLIPLSPTTRLAAFYFDGNPRMIFRFRYYQLLIEESNDHVNMKLYTLNPLLEQELRATNDATEWPRVFQDFAASHKDDLNEEPLVKELYKCDVQWSRDMDPVQHEYALSHFRSGKDSFHAIMIFGQALMNSTMIPGQEILIKDQLSLSQNDFWIHDRGFNPETGDYIYGNQRGVPYQLERVTCIHPDTGKREIVHPQLQWTLGEAWRTEQEYQNYMDLVGGVSSKLNS